MAKVEAREVGRFLGGGWKSFPVVLIYGGDEGSVRETADDLRQRAGGAEQDPMNRIEIDGDVLAADPARLADEMRAFGMFGGFRTVHVRGAAKAPVAVVEAIADDPAEGALLILEAGDLKKESGLRKLAEKHRGIAVIARYADGARDINGLIDDMLRDNGLGISRDARALLVTVLGADRSLSRSELDKLALYAQGSGDIDITTVTDIVADAGRHEISTVVDLAFAGDIAAVEPEAGRLFRAGTHPSVVLTLAIGQAFLFRRALRIGLAETLRSARLHFSRQAMVERAVPRWTEARLTRAIGILSDATLQTRRTASIADSITIRALWATARLARSDRDN